MPNVESVDNCRATLKIAKGENIRINKLSLDTAEVIIEGEISSLAYSQNKQEKNSGTLLSKIFK